MENFMICLQNKFTILYVLGECNYKTENKIPIFASKIHTGHRLHSYFFSVTTGVLSRNTFERLETEIHPNENNVSSGQISSSFVMFVRTA